MTHPARLHRVITARARQPPRAVTTRRQLPRAATTRRHLRAAIARVRRRVTTPHLRRAAITPASRRAVASPADRATTDLVEAAPVRAPAQARPAARPAVRTTAPGPATIGPVLRLQARLVAGPAAREPLERVTRLPEAAILGQTT